MLFFQPTYRKRIFLPFRGGTASVPVGVEGTPIEAIIPDCHGDEEACSPYGDGTVYGDGELYCAADEGKDFYLSLCEVEPHVMAVRIQHSAGARLIVDTVKPHLRSKPAMPPYQHQTEVDSNCPQHLAMRVRHTSSSQTIVRRLLPFVNVRRNRPVA